MFSILLNMVALMFDITDFAQAPFMPPTHSYTLYIPLLSLQELEYFMKVLLTKE